MTLTVLGTSTPYPRPDQPCSGYLVRTPTTALWVDAGSGTFAELQRHMDLERLDAIWISHLHPDHAGDLPAIANWLINRPYATVPLPIYGPPKWSKRLDSFLPTDPALLAGRIDIHDLADGDEAVVGGLHLVSRFVQHGVPTFGLRVSYGRHVLAYSGDSGPCDALVELARDATWFLCEAGVAEQPPGDSSGHCTPENAAVIARNAQATLLVLTHLAPGLEAHVARQRALGHFPHVEVAVSGAEFRA